MYIVQDKEAGNPIDCFETRKNAENALLLYEEQDKAEGVYEENFYEIIKADLSAIRRCKNLSQSKLAEITGLNVRMIQYYEQGVKDINKAQAITLYKLSKVLGCKIEDLLNI